MKNKKNHQKWILILVLFLIVFCIVFIFYKSFQKVPAKTLDLPERNYTVPEVPILSDFGTKIVYTTDTTIPKDIYINDCSSRGGVFNTCGNICAPAAAATCPITCALTCEIK